MNGYKSEVSLPYRIEYAHQMRPDSEAKPFDLKWAYVTWRTFPADDIDPVPTYQVLFQGKPISEAMATPQEAIADATYWLMDQSRAKYKRGMVVLNTKADGYFCRITIHK